MINYSRHDSLKNLLFFSMKLLLCQSLSNDVLEHQIIGSVFLVTHVSKSDVGDEPLWPPVNRNTTRPDRI